MTTADAHQKIEAAIDSLASQLDAGLSDAMRRYLSTLARFHRYSTGNLLLLHVQMPDATRVAGYRTWQRLGRAVRKGEKGLAILAPCGGRSRAEEAEDDGEGAAAPAAVRRFRVVYVFDISQTDGEDLPQPSRVTGDPGAYLARLEAFAAGEGIAVAYVEHLGGALGRSSGGRIEILQGLDPAQRLSVLAHECAHELLHWSVPAEVRKDKRLVETQAEATAFVVCSAIGLDTNTAAADYVALYGGSRELLKQSLAAIQTAAGRILAAITPGQ